MDDLQNRVEKFQALELPGQPMGMHMGTLYLVNDLWLEVQRLRKTLEFIRDYPDAPVPPEQDAQ